MVADEHSTLARTVLGMLEAALPFNHRPALEVVCGEVGEDAAEIDLSVAQRAKPPGPVDPGLVSAVNALAAARIELRVLDVEHLDAVGVDVDEGEIVELLQHEVARIVEDVAARMVVDALQQHLECDAVMQILARMDLVAEIDPGLVEGVEDRPPAARKLVERGLHQTRRALRPGIDEGPGQGAGEGRVIRQAEILRRQRRLQHLIDRPFLAGAGVAPNLGRGETVERLVVCRMHGDELALQVHRQFGYDQPLGREQALDLIAIVLARRCFFEVE